MVYDFIRRIIFVVISVALCVAVHKRCVCAHGLVTETQCAHTVVHSIARSFEVNALSGLSIGGRCSSCVICSWCNEQATWCIGTVNSFRGSSMLASQSVSFLEVAEPTMTKSHKALRVVHTVLVGIYRPVFS